MIHLDFDNPILRYELLDFTGVTEEQLEASNNHVFKLIPVAQLFRYGTLAGTENNHPFQTDVTAFLRDWGIEEIHALVHVATHKILSIALPLSDEAVGEFEILIEDNAGILNERGSDLGLDWSIFVST
jgi:hypothetical protein